MLRRFSGDSGGHGHLRLPCCTAAACCVASLPCHLDLSRLLQADAPLQGCVSCSGLSVVAWQIFHPVINQPQMLLLQVVYGLIVGAGCAFICSWTRLWNNVFKRTAALLISG